MVSWIAATPLRWHILGVLVVALAVSGLFGGLDRVSRPDLPAVAEDQRYDGKPWNVTVNGVGTLTDATDFRLEPETDGDRWLVASITVEVTSERSRADFEESIRLRPLAGLRDPKPKKAVLRRDAPGPAYDLHPGMPEELYLFWELAGDATPPRQVEIEIVGMTYRKDSLTGHLDWKDPESKAVVRAAVKDLDAAA